MTVLRSCRHGIKACSVTSGKGKYPDLNPSLTHGPQCVFLFPFLTFLSFLDSTSNGLKVPLTAPTIAKSSSNTTISPRNGSALPSSCFSVSPHVRSLQLHREIVADYDHSNKVAHTLQAARSRLWWLFPTAVFCGFLEVSGWSARLWSHFNPYLQAPFIIQ
jgi:hypothetical protein